MNSETSDRSRRLLQPLRSRYAPFRPIAGESAPLGWPLVDRRSTLSTAAPPNGVNRRQMALNGAPLPYEAISMAPFRVAALAVAVVRGFPLYRDVNLGLIGASLAMLVYTLFVLRKPVPSDSLRRETRRLVELEQIIVTAAVLVSGAWSSPLALCLIPTAILAGLVAEAAYALLLTAGGAIAISALHLRDGWVASRVQAGALWFGVLCMAAMVAGLIRKTAAETARKQSAALDQLGQLSQANGLLSHLHRVTQMLPASLDLDDVLDSTVMRVRQLIPHDMLTIFLANETSGALEVVRRHGYSAEAGVQVVEECPTLIEAMRGTNSVRRDYLVGKRGTPRLSVSPTGKSGVYASLRARGVVIGVIAIESLDVRHFTDQHSEIVHGLAEPLGIAVDNARLFRKLRVVGADEERNRIARDLHDRIGSSLASLGFALDGTLMAARRGETVTDELQELRNYVTTMIGDVREALYDLRSDVNDTQDLASTLRQFADRVEGRSGLAIRFTSQQEIRLPILQEREIWHIAREAIINVERHAQATALGIDWVCTQSRVALTINDNGVGLEAGTARADSYGMVGMKERAESIDGMLTTSTSSSGTVICVELRRPTGA